MADGAIRIVEKYAMADIKGRIEIVLDSYLNGSHDLLKLADETDCTYDGVKNRLKRARNRIRQSTASYRFECAILFMVVEAPFDVFFGD